MKRSGDGLCLSTPSGSTAYNKALGGAIIHPSIRAIQLAEMASINNRVFRTVGSPLLLPDHHNCVIKPRNDVDFQVTIDHLTLPHKDVKSILCRVANEKSDLQDSVLFRFGKGCRTPLSEKANRKRKRIGQLFIQKNMTAREAGMTVKEYTALLGISKRLLADIKFGGETCL